MPVTLVDEVIEDAAGSLVQLFDLHACVFELFPFDRQLPRIESGRIVLPAAEPGVEPWACDRGVELPVRCNGLTVGRFVLIPESATVGVGFSPDARARAMTIATGLGAVIAAALVD